MRLHILVIITSVNRCAIIELKNESVNLSKTVLQGPEIYEDRKTELDIAVQEYHQAIGHLTARIVAGTALEDLAYERNKIRESSKGTAQAG